MKPKIGFKQFPFAWRDKWLALFRESPTAAAIWDFMWWKSDVNGIFDLPEGLMCKDLNLNPKTVHKARSLIARHGGFERLCHRNELGQLVVRYQMHGFDKDKATKTADTRFTPSPKNGSAPRAQKTGFEPEPSLRTPVKRTPSVATPSVDTKEEVDTEAKLASTPSHQEEAKPTPDERKGRVPDKSEEEFEALPDHLQDWSLMVSQIWCEALSVKETDKLVLQCSLLYDLIDTPDAPEFPDWFRNSLLRFLKESKFWSARTANPKSLATNMKSFSKGCFWDQFKAWEAKQKVEEPSYLDEQGKEQGMYYYDCGLHYNEVPQTAGKPCEHCSR